LDIVIITPVADSAVAFTGVMVPVMMIGVAPEYDAALV
jgi:hypothetical protein